jgi:hypothetical protein
MNRVFGMMVANLLGLVASTDVLAQHIWHPETLGDVKNGRRQFSITIQE